MSLDPMVKTEFQFRRMCIFALWTYGLLLLEVMEERHWKAQGTAEDIELYAEELIHVPRNLYIKSFLCLCASGWVCLTVLATPESTPEQGQAACFLLRDAPGFSS